MLFNMLSVIGLVLLSIWLTSTATAQDVEYSSVPGTNFAAYKTYKWEKAEKAKYPDGLVDQFIRQSVEAELAKKGLSKTESDDADLYVVYQFANREDITWSTFTNEIAWQGGANSLAGFRGATTNSSYVIRRGHLTIDLYDVKQKRLVWEAEATKTIKDKVDPAKVEGNFQKAIAKIFKKYPANK